VPKLRRERLVEVPSDIFDGLDANVQASEVGRHACAIVLLRFSRLCALLARCMARLLASPTLARWLKSLSFSMKERRASSPPYVPRPKMAPGPSGMCYLATSLPALSVARRGEHRCPARDPMEEE
jgi:hypothetical protein